MPDTLTQDDWQSHPERADDLVAHYKAGLTFQAARARLLNGRSRLWGGLFAAAMVGLIAEFVGIAGLVPSQHLVPMFLVIQPDGTVDSYASITSLPATQEQAVLRATIWKYIRDRESYNWADAPGRYTFVSAISSPQVRDVYQGWFLPKNSASPQNVIAQRGQIDVEKISMIFPYPNVATVRYRRIAQFYGQKPLVTTWTATAEFQVTTRLPGGVRDEGDPGGLVVTRYMVSEDTPCQ